MAIISVPATKRTNAKAAQPMPAAGTGPRHAARGPFCFAVTRFYSAIVSRFGVLFSEALSIRVFRGQSPRLGKELQQKRHQSSRTHGRSASCGTPAKRGSAGRRSFTGRRCPRRGLGSGRMWAPIGIAVLSSPYSRRICTAFRGGGYTRWWVPAWRESIPLDYLRHARPNLIPDTCRPLSSRLS